MDNTPCGHDQTTAHAVFTLADMSQFEPTKLTWTALLGRWIDFARSALALPDDAEGRAWKQSVPAIIGLQAVVMALHHSDELDADQRAVGRDRARVLIERHTRELHDAFGDDQPHPMLVELITDAWSAVKADESPNTD
jgi:hypothetical protein